jgi:putative transposase
MNTLLVGDELFDQKAQRVAMVVTAPTLVMGKLRVLEADAETERMVPHEDIRARISRGELEIRRKGNPQLTVFIDREDRTTRQHKGLKKNPRREHAEDARLSSIAKATRIVRTVNEYCRRHRVSAYAAYPAVRQQLEGESSNWAFPSLATMYRLLERDHCGAPLVKPNHLKGNRLARHPAELSDLICEEALALFLVEGSQWELKDLTDKCRRTAIRHELLEPSALLSIKYVRKVIVTRLYANPAVARLLSKDRAAKSSIASHRIRVEGILQRVEQDAVHLPFVIKTKDGPCSDVWLVHAIDCATSNIVGWYLKIGSANESDGLRCVESIVFSKGAAFKYLGLDDCHDLYGIPALLVLDNGAEARGERFRRLAQLGIDVEYLKARHPQKKPFVERLNRSVKEALQLLPGCTRMDGRDGRRDPVALGDDLMDLEELERWIVRWYFDKWADTVLDRFVDEEVSEDRALGVTPRQRYENIVERLGCPLPLPPNRDDWIRIKYNSVSRILSMKSGITHKGYKFRGDNLERLINRFGERRVDVLLDPEDFRRVYVMNGSELVELENQSVDEFTPAYAFSKAKAKKSSVKGQHPETPRSAAFTEDVQTRSTQSAPKPAGQRKAPGRAAKREVVEKTRHRAAVDLAALDPLASSKQPKAPALNGPMPMQLDDVDELSPRDRKTGALL